MPSSGRAASPRSTRARTRSGSSCVEPGHAAHRARARHGDHAARARTWTAPGAWTRERSGAHRGGAGRRSVAVRARWAPSGSACGATSAVRDAENREEFARPCAGTRRRRWRSSPVSRRPACRSWAGRTDSIRPTGRSWCRTSAAVRPSSSWGPNPAARSMRISTQMGSVRLTERHIRHDPPTRGGTRRAGDRGDGRRPDGGRGRRAGARGSNVRGGGGDRDHHAGDRARAWIATTPTGSIARRSPWPTPNGCSVDLAAMTDAERAAMPVMAPGRGRRDRRRARVVLVDHDALASAFDRALVSETDILDGLAFEMLDIR